MLDLLKVDPEVLFKRALARLHRHAFSNREEIDRSVSCRCFRCNGQFHRKDIRRWEVRTWHGEPVFPGPQPPDTAVCPKCGYPSVIGDACGSDLNRRVLKELSRFDAVARYDSHFDCTWIRPDEPPAMSRKERLLAHRRRAAARAKPAGSAPLKAPVKPPPPPPPRLPMSGYLRFKAARFLAEGHALYRRTDALRQPPEGTSAEDLELLRVGFAQIVEGRGFLRATPLEHLGARGLELLMQVAHFELLRHQPTARAEPGLDAVVFRQRGSGREVVVFNLVTPTAAEDENGRLNGGLGSERCG